MRSVDSVASAARGLTFNGAVRPDRIVHAARALDQHLGLHGCAEDLAGGILSSACRSEAIVVAVLPWTT